MKGTFYTSEIVNLLHCRIPWRGKPWMRLQNFLLGYEDWKTNTTGSLHIGERGELGLLRKALGQKRQKIVEDIEDKFAQKRWDEGAESGSEIFPTKASWSEFLREVRQGLGNRIELEM